MSKLTQAFFEKILAAEGGYQNQSADSGNFNRCSVNAGTKYGITPNAWQEYSGEQCPSVPDSAHTRGWAADIAARTLEQKIRIVRAARTIGFNRFGIYDSFIHLDCDPGKRGDAAWNGKLNAVGKGGDFSSFLFDPFAV